MWLRVGRSPAGLTAGKPRGERVRERRGKRTGESEGGERVGRREKREGGEREEKGEGEGVIKKGHNNLKYVCELKQKQQKCQV